METKNLTNIMGLVVIVILLGAFTAPIIMDAADRTETYVNESPEWVRLALAEDATTADYDFEITISDDQATIGTLSGDADDIVLYADDVGAIMAIDGKLYYIYSDNGTTCLFLGSYASVENSNGTLTVADSESNTYSRESPTWAYYPSADGRYSSYKEGNLLMDNDCLAVGGSFAGVVAYNDCLYPALGLNQVVNRNGDTLINVSWGVTE